MTRGDVRDGTADNVQHRLIRHGHEQLLRLLDDILSSTHDGTESCSCLVRGAELRSMLIRQLRLEPSAVCADPAATEAPEEDA